MYLFSLLWKWRISAEILFLDVLVSRKSNRSLGNHEVYRNQLIPTCSFIPSSGTETKAVLNTLINRPKRVTEKENLIEENKYLTNAFENNG